MRRIEVSRRFANSPKAKLLLNHIVSKTLAGQGDTPSGMKYRIYILSTKTELPIGELTKQPENPRESPVITVTLKK